MSTFWAFVKCLPELFALFRTLEAQARESEIERKVKDDIVTIHESFNDKDPAKLNALFKSR